MISNWNLLSDLERSSVKILFASLNLQAKEFPIDVKKLLNWLAVSLSLAVKPSLELVFHYTPAR